ncbi:hypothetical protein ACHQM5_009240 [Ranunculus cassubicifolius]
MAEIVLVNENKRSREDEPVSDSPEAKRIRDDLNLLEILDDTEPAEATQDLASVMKSFEEEICMSSLLPRTTSDSGDSQPDLGYLLEASDDELGLPPVFSGSSEEVVEENDVIVVPSCAVGYEQIWRVEDEIPNGYDFGLGDDEFSGNSNGVGNGNGEFLTLDGLFDYSDVYSGQSDYSDFLYRPESLPAL